MGKRFLSLIVLVMLTVFMSSIAAAAQQSSSALCADSDGGVIYGVKGIARGMNGEKTDSCLGKKTLQEWQCRRDMIVSLFFKCPGVCSDGACVGYVDYQTAESQTTTTTLKDVFETSSTTTTTLRRAREKCADTDGGKNYGTVGTTKGVNGEKTDSCLGKKKLQEWYCKRDMVASIMFQCPNGCVNGSCTGMTDWTTTTTTQTTSSTTASTTTTLGGESSTTTTTTVTTTTLETSGETSITTSTTTTTTLQQGAGAILRCYDSDGGKAYDVKGYASGLNGRKSDKCMDGARLQEAYCEGLLAKIDKIKCEKGCFAGACRG